MRSQGPTPRQHTEYQVLATVISRNGAECDRSQMAVGRFGGSSLAVAKAWDCIIPAGTVGGQADAVLIRSKGTSMQIVLGPVLVRRGGYAFDCWTPEKGFSCGYTYGRIEDAHYARNVEIRSRNNESSDQTIACSTVDEFVRLTI